MRTTNLLAVTIAAVALVGCGAKMTTADAGSIITGGGTGATGGGTGGGNATGGGTGRDAGTVDAGPSMGTNCANAIPLMLGDQPTGEIATAGQKIFYSFPVTAGDYVDMLTQVNPDDLSDVLDTSLTLWDATGSMKLAANDDAFPRISTDSDLFYHATTTGTLCLSVEDFSTWKPDAPPAPIARPGDIFTLAVTKIPATAAFASFDTEPNDMTTAPQTGKSQLGTSGNFAFGLVFGTLSSATDVDVFKFTSPTTTPQVTVNFAPLGKVPNVGDNGYGSGLDRVTVRVLTTTGTVLGQWTANQATIDQTPDNIGVVIPAGSDVLVEISRPTGSTATGNDFYVVEVDFGTDNPPEAADVTNNVATTPEAISFMVDATDAKLKQGFIVGNLSSATDVDHYSIPVLANDKVTLACGGLRNGSGLTGTYEMLNGTTSLQTETETLASDIFWSSSMFATKPEITATATGNLTFKITGTIDASNPSSYYRCGFSVTSP